MYKSDGRQQQAGHRGHTGRQAPNQAIQTLHRNAHVIGRQLVLRGRLHGDAQLAVLEHGKQAQAKHGRESDHYQLLGRDHQRTHLQNLPGIRHGHGVGVGAHIRDHGDQTAQHIAHANGQHDDGKSGLPQNGTNDQALEQDAEYAHGHDGGWHRNPKREAQPRHGSQSREGADHHQVALSKAHRFSGLVDQHKTQGNESIDTALGYPADQQLQQLHACLLFCTSAVLPCTLRL